MSYPLIDFNDLKKGTDVFGHAEKLAAKVLLPTATYRCTLESNANEPGRPDTVDGIHAVSILNKIRDTEGHSLVHAPLVLSSLESLLYVLLKTETCQERATSYAQCLGSLQRVLDTMDTFGPVACSRLKAYAFGSTVCGMQNMASDLDICIDGKIESAPKNTWEEYNHLNMLSSVVRFSKQKFLHELADLLIHKKVADESTLERVIHARIPVFNYIDRETGVKCDIIVGSETFRFKATILALLGSIDWRFLALVRLVKLWASHHKLLDASLGMLNSYSLKLLVLFHLQNRPIPVLPTLCIGSGNERPIQNGPNRTDSHQESTLRMLDYIDGFKRKSVAFQSNRNENLGDWNTESLSELFVSFMRFIADLTSLEYIVGDVTLMQRLKVDAWDGSFLYSHKSDTERAYHLYIRDPFESKPDNAARSLSLAGEREIQAHSVSFCDAFTQTCGIENPTYNDILVLLTSAFGKDHADRADASYQSLMNKSTHAESISEDVDDSASVDCLLDPNGTKCALQWLKRNDNIRYRI